MNNALSYNRRRIAHEKSLYKGKLGGDIALKSQTTNAWHKIKKAISDLHRGAENSESLNAHPDPLANEYSAAKNDDPYDYPKRKGEGK